MLFPITAFRITIPKTIPLTMTTIRNKTVNFRTNQEAAVIWAIRKEEVFRFYWLKRTKIK